MLHFWLMDLLGYEPHFPIPTLTTGAEALFEAKTNRNGVVVVSIHLPLANFILRHLTEIGCPPDAVLAAGYLLKNGKYVHGGTAEGIWGLAIDRNVLLKVRSILHNGGLVFGLIDIHPGAPLNSNLLRLAGLVRARLVFAVTEFGKSGEAVARFYAPPDPFCSSRESVLSNIEFFQAKVDEILQSHPEQDHERYVTPSTERSLSNEHEETVSEIGNTAAL